MGSCAPRTGPGSEAAEAQRCAVAIAETLFTTEARRKARLSFLIPLCLCGEKLLFLSAMPRTLDPELRRALAARIRYYNEMGIYDFYRQPLSDRAGEVPISVDEAEIAISTNHPESGEEM